MKNGLKRVFLSIFFAAVDEFLDYRSYSSNGLSLCSCQSSPLTQNRHGYFSCNKLGTRIQLPMCSLHAIHFGLVVVSCRNRRASATLLFSPLGRPGKFSSLQPCRWRCSRMVLEHSGTQIANLRSGASLGVGYTMAGSCITEWGP